MNPVLERLIWVINGLLAVVFSIGDHLIPLLLGISLGAFFWFAPEEQRGWTVGAAVLAVVASVFVPAPVPVFLLVMSLGGWAALFLEKYNRPAVRWNIVRGISLYAVTGIGVAAYRAAGMADAVAADPQMAQGAVYLNALVGIVLYVIPLGYLVMLAQAIWAHPPAPGGRPADLISVVRTRGKR